MSNPFYFAWACVASQAMTDARDVIRDGIIRETGASLATVRANAAITALTAADYRILGPDEVAALQKALSRAEDGAGTLPAKEAVKLRPADWHALSDLVRALGRKA